MAKAGAFGDASALLKALELEPKDLKIYDQALIHRSILNETGQTLASNERLEFLGDSVLGLVVARFLYDTFPDLSEGQLALRGCPAYGVKVALEPRY